MTPLHVIANVAGVVTRAVDDVTGDRNGYPLLVAQACVEGLKRFGIESRVMFGQAAWLEVLEDHTVLWTGCWSGACHFWVANRSGEVIDCNASVSHRKPVQLSREGTPLSRPLYSPPMLWSAEVPRFYRYLPEGVAEAAAEGDREKRWTEAVLKAVREGCGPERAPEVPEPVFPDEPILCPGRKLLDDSKGTFRLYDRAISVAGIPEAPF